MDEKKIRNLKQVVVQTMHESELANAKSLLIKNNAIQSDEECYVHGWADEEEIQQLVSSGMVVEELREESVPFNSDSEETIANELSIAYQGHYGKAFSDKQFYVVQIKGPLFPEWNEQLAQIGVVPISLLAPSSFIVQLDSNQKNELDKLPFVAQTKLYGGKETLRGCVNKAASRRDTFREKKLPTVKETKNCSNTIESVSNLIIEEDGDDADRAPDSVNEIADADASGNLDANIEGVEIDKPDWQIFELWCHRSDDLDEVAELMKEDSSRVTDVQKGKTRIRFSCDTGTSVLSELKLLPQVASIEPYTLPQLEGTYARLAIGVETPGGDVVGFDGTDITVGVADSGVDLTHPGLNANNIITSTIVTGANKEKDPSGHGTHVCGIIAGQGERKGIAPGARLFVQRMCDNNRNLRLPLNLEDILKPAYDANVRIHNNSWGYEVEGRYSVNSLEMDQFVYDHPDFLVVVAAGNEGKEAQPPRQGFVDYASLRAPASAKNVLTVGAVATLRNDGPSANKTWADLGRVAHDPNGGCLACSDIDRVAALSSRGPTDDERVKPDLIAPGIDILSSWPSTLSNLVSPGHQIVDDTNNGLYVFKSGTSFAAPVVSGAAALVYEYFMKVRHHTPSAALLKAALINSCRFIDQPEVRDPEVGIPNFHQGFGRLDLGHIFPTNQPNFSLAFIDINRNSPDCLDSNFGKPSRFLRVVNVNKGAPLRITLCWTDRPGRGLQQDLDLTVRAPNMQVIAGNQHLKRPAFAPNDRKNNVEQVIIPEADIVEGEYTIAVFAYNTPFEAQGFSLVVTGNLDGDWHP